MDAMQAMLTRRSVRKYTKDMVPQEVLEKIIEAGTYAASAKNRQPWLILAITNQELIGKLAAMNCAVLGVDRAGYDPFFGAPVLLIVLAKKDVPSRVYDGTLVTANLMLAAHAMGLGTCWVNRAYDEFESEEGKQILRELGVEGEYEGIGHVTLGYPDGPVKEAAPRRDCVVYVK